MSPYTDLYFVFSLKLLSLILGISPKQFIKALFSIDCPRHLQLDRVRQMCTLCSSSTLNLVIPLVPNTFQDPVVQSLIKVTVYLQRCLASKRCSASALNCRYLNPCIKLKLIELSIKLYQEF